MTAIFNIVLNGPIRQCHYADFSISWLVCQEWFYPQLSGCDLRPGLHPSAFNPPPPQRVTPSARTSSFILSPSAFNPSPTHRVRSSDHLCLAVSHPGTPVGNDSLLIGCDLRPGLHPSSFILHPSTFNSSPTHRVRSSARTSSFILHPSAFNSSPTHRVRSSARTSSFILHPSAFNTSPTHRVTSSDSTRAIYGKGHSCGNDPLLIG